MDLVSMLQIAHDPRDNKSQHWLYFSSINIAVHMGENGSKDLKLSLVFVMAGILFQRIV